MPPAPAGPLHLARARGLAGAGSPRDRAHECRNPGCDGGERSRAVVLAAYARAILYNGLGRYAAALAAARQACEDEDLCPAPWD